MTDTESQSETNSESETAISTGDMFDNLDPIVQTKSSASEPKQAAVPWNLSRVDSEHLPWSEKYRPTRLDDVASHYEIIKSLKKFIERKTLPHLLFFGPSGTGKTTSILCCAREFYGQYINCMVLQLNASNERGIETVRTKIKNFVSNKNSIFLPAQMQNLFKLVILDEIDSMTVEAQGMLRQTIEKNSDTTRFCLICNDIDKINMALQSRCAPFRFSPLPQNDMYNTILKIVNQEKVNCEDEAILAIMKISHGDMRLSINMLQHITLTITKKITASDVYSITGYCAPISNTEIFDILMKIHNRQIRLKKAVNTIQQIILEHNLTIFNLLDELKNIILECKTLQDHQKIYLIDNFGKNEIYDSVGVDSINILLTLTSLFLIMPA